MPIIVTYWKLGFVLQCLDVDSVFCKQSSDLMERISFESLTISSCMLYDHMHVPLHEHVKIEFDVTFDIGTISSDVICDRVATPRPVSWLPSK
jgi:hypothetical protein